MLYELFYEIKSELLGCKIEMDEEDFQSNIKKITIPKLVDYLHDSIQILIRKKIEETKEEQKIIDKEYYEKNINFTNNINNLLEIGEKAQYENIIRKLESKERILSKIVFQKQLQKDSLEIKMVEYIEMEEEFEEMKTKLKYEEGRFLRNDRKDNEIKILRGENSNLKISIKEMEEKIKNLENDIVDKNKKISELQDNIKKNHLKIKELQKQNEILNDNFINININSMSSNNRNTNLNNNINNNCSNNNLNNNASFLLEGKKNLTKNKFISFKKINQKILYRDKEKIKNNNKKNEMLERSKSELNKCILTNKNNNNVLLNYTILKMQSPQNRKNKQLSPFNNNEMPVPFFSNHMNINNYNFIQRNIISGIKGSRSDSSKLKKNNKGINYKSFL
jgi:hypothetical protein